MFSSIRSAAKKMLIDFEGTMNIPHNVTKGNARESIVFKNFIEPYLPARFSVGSGLIMDANNKGSRQQDFVIYDAFYSPMLRDLNSDKIFFPESVFAVIEVKSNLTSKEVDDMVNKSVSVWNLFKTPHPFIVISPGVSIPGSYSPTLCVGIAFESSLSIDDIAVSIREIRNSNPEKHALSYICVLRDKNGDSGIILNVNDKNLEQVAIIPSQNSRLAVSRSESPGDVLLYAYLILMQHLRNCGSLFAGPDLIHYAQTSGVGLSNYNISRDEMKGSFVEVSGQSHSIDIIKRASEFSKKVLNGIASDDEILEWFYLMPEIPSGEALLDPNSIFSENFIPITMPGPLAVRHAIERRKNGAATESDKILIKQFICLIRSIREQGRKIEMGYKSQ